MGHRTVSLTNQAPVFIDENEWPLVVRAGAYGFKLCFIEVRRHADGRVLVSGVYKTHGSKREYAGYLLDAPTILDIECALEHVAKELISYTGDASYIEPRLEKALTLLRGEGGS